MIPASLIAWGTRAAGFLGQLLSFGVTLPLWIFLAGGLWLHLDKASAVRKAVDSAVTDLVAGAEISAANARATALQAVVDEQNRKLAAEKQANRLFAERLAASQKTQSETEDAIQNLLARPVAGDCHVHDDVYGRLHNR
jgi:hypothetical protein